MFSLKKFLLNSLSVIYHNCLPKKVRKIIGPFVGLAHSVIHRIYSISSDIYTPVSLFRENTNQNGVNLNLFVAGKGNNSAFLLDRLCHTEPKVTRQGRRFIWKLPSINKSSAHATLIEADRCFSHFFLRHGFIPIPEWVLFTMDISMPLENM